MFEPLKVIYINKEEIIECNPLSKLLDRYMSMIESWKWF